MGGEKEVWVLIYSKRDSIEMVNIIPVMDSIQRCRVWNSRTLAWIFLFRIYASRRGVVRCGDMEELVSTDAVDYSMVKRSRAATSSMTQHVCLKAITHTSTTLSTLSDGFCGQQLYFVKDWLTAIFHFMF